MEKSTQHLKAIDQLRGIAILLVLANHTFGWAKVKYPQPFAHGTELSLTNIIGFSATNIFANGFFGVMIFFVLSGFCIRWSHLNASKFKWSDFYKRRFFRIFPAYWFWLAVAAYMANAEPKDIFFHGILAHNFSKEYFHSIYGPFWSIAIEWQIYLIYPLLFFAAAKVPPKVMLLMLACIGVCSNFISSGFVSSLLETKILSIFGRLPTALLFSWMLGYYLAESLKKEELKKPSLGILMCSIALGILAYSHPNTCFLASAPWSYAAYHLVLLFLSKSHSFKLRFFDAISWIGVISYSVYLSHDLFAGIYPYIANFLDLPKGGFIAGAVTLQVMTLPMLTLGYISYRLIEIPGISLGKRIRI